MINWVLPSWHADYSPLLVGGSSTLLVKLQGLGITCPMGSFYWTVKLHRCLLPLHQIGQHSLQKGTTPPWPVKMLSCSSQLCRVQDQVACP